MTKSQAGTMVHKWQEHHKRTVDRAIDQRSAKGENDNVYENHTDVNDTGRVWSFK
jgi:hypothetical protein